MTTSRRSLITPTPLSQGTLSGPALVPARVRVDSHEQRVRQRPRTRLHFGELVEEDLEPASHLLVLLLVEPQAEPPRVHLLQVGDLRDLGAEGLEHRRGEVRPEL